MNSTFIDVLNEKYSGQFIIGSNINGYPFIRFPAKNPGFGDVEIYGEMNQDIHDEKGEEYTVELMKFTHTHIETGAEVIELIDDILSDNIIPVKSWWYGGYYYRDKYEKKRRRKRLLKKLHVWSGLYTPTIQRSRPGE